MEKIIILLSAFIAASLQGQIIPQEFGAEKLSAYVDKFNADDDELSTTFPIRRPRIFS